MIINNVLQLIGKTPVLKVNKLFGSKHNVFIKLERFNPGGSIKDRIAFNMIEEAEKRGEINKDTVIIEPTSGNTGVGLAMVCAVKGYKLILVMPESMSIERRKLMSAYGANFALTPREKGMKGAIAKATELLNEYPNSWMPQQFENIDNIEAHIKTTSNEIIDDFPDGIDYLITGVGTGGHISGCAKVLKEKFKNLQVFAVEPEQSAVIGGGSANPHPIQGIGAGFIPKNLYTELLDGVIPVGKIEAYEFVNQLATKEGVLAGISTGASLAAINKKLGEIPDGKTILTFNYDTGERYLSVEGLF